MESASGEIHLSRAELYERVWKMPMRQLAAELRVSGTGLRKNWSDGKRKHLEDCLGDFVVHLETVGPGRGLDS